MLVYINKIYFYIDLYSVMLLNSFVSCKSYFCRFLGVSSIGLVLPVDKGMFISSFAILRPSIFLFGLTVLLGTSGFCDSSAVWPCGPTDCSLPGSSVHGVSQARILEWACHFLLQGIFQTGWLKLIRIGILALFHILGGNHSIFHH